MGTGAWAQRRASRTAHTVSLTGRTVGKEAVFCGPIARELRANFRFS